MESSRNAIPNISAENQFHAQEKIIDLDFELNSFNDYLNDVQRAQKEKVNADTFIDRLNSLNSKADSLIIDGKISFEENMFLAETLELIASDPNLQTILNSNKSNLSLKQRRLYDKSCTLIANSRAITSRRLYRDIPESELNNQSGAHILETVHDYQNFSFYVLINIVKHQSYIKCMLAIERWCNVLDQSLINRDYHTASAIFAAISNLAVDHFIWNPDGSFKKELSEKNRKLLSYMTKLFDSGSEFAIFRSVMFGSAIPFLGPFKGQVGKSELFLKNAIEIKNAQEGECEISLYKSLLLSMQKANENLPQRQSKKDHWHKKNKFSLENEITHLIDKMGGINNVVKKIKSMPLSDDQKQKCINALTDFVENKYKLKIQDLSEVLSKVNEEYASTDMKLTSLLRGIGRGSIQNYFEYKKYESQYCQITKEANETLQKQFYALKKVLQDLNAEGIESNIPIEMIEALKQKEKERFNVIFKEIENKKESELKELNMNFELSFAAKEKSREKLEKKDEKLGFSLTELKEILLDSEEDPFLKRERNIASNNKKTSRSKAKDLLGLNQNYTIAEKIEIFETIVTLNQLHERKRERKFDLDSATEGYNLTLQQCLYSIATLSMIFYGGKEFEVREAEEKSNSIKRKIKQQTIKYLPEIENLKKAQAILAKKQTIFSKNQALFVKKTAQESYAASFKSIVETMSNLRAKVKPNYGDESKKPEFSKIPGLVKAMGFKKSDVRSLGEPSDVLFLLNQAINGNKEAIKKINIQLLGGSEDGVKALCDPNTILILSDNPDEWRDQVANLIKLIQPIFRLQEIFRALEFKTTSSEKSLYLLQAIANDKSKKPCPFTDEIFNELDTLRKFYNKIAEHEEKINQLVEQKQNKTENFKKDNKSAKRNSLPSDEKVEDSSKPIKKKRGSAPTEIRVKKQKPEINVNPKKLNSRSSSRNMMLFDSTDSAENSKTKTRESPRLTRKQSLMLDFFKNRKVKKNSGQSDNVSPVVEDKQIQNENQNINREKLNAAKTNSIFDEHPESPQNILPFQMQMFQQIMDSAKPQISLKLERSYTNQYLNENEDREKLTK